MGNQHSAKRPYLIMPDEMLTLGVGKYRNLAKRVAPFRVWPMLTPADRDAGIADLLRDEVESESGWNWEACVSEFSPCDPGVFMIAAGRPKRGVEAILSGYRDTMVTAYEGYASAHYSFYAELVFTRPDARRHHLASALTTAACMQISDDVHECVKIMRRSRHDLKALYLSVRGEAHSEGGHSVLDAIYQSMCSTVEILEDELGVEIPEPEADYGI